MKILVEWRGLASIWIKEDEQAYQQIVALIKKPEVTEEWIEEKAKELHDKVAKLNSKTCKYKCGAMERYRDFIRSLVEEVGK